MLYPFKFKPILKPLIWGGNQICRFKGIEPQEEGIGESWEISAIPGAVSVVNNGELEGKSLEELIDIYGERFSGRKALERFGKTFPLLIKFIDAKTPLSIQVHPNDEHARKAHDSCGKTEMWYVIKADDDAYICSGFSREMTPEQYLNSLKDHSFMDYLNCVRVQPGDVFYLPAGRVHSIGGGCLIAEIQQTSDITYRIYDYDRRDSNGNPRELHTELAKDVIDYTLLPEPQTRYNKEQKGIQHLLDCPYFSTKLIDARAGDILHRTSHDTFNLFICLEGQLTLTDNRGYSVEMKQGETVLVPAENTLTVLQFDVDSKLLQTYIS